MHQNSKRQMPFYSRCEGLPDGPCPRSRQDRSVQLGSGDLFLCPDCDEARHRLFIASLPQLPPFAVVSRPSSTTPTTSGSTAVAAVPASMTASSPSFNRRRSRRKSKGVACATNRPPIAFGGNKQYHPVPTSNVAVGQHQAANNTLYSGRQCD